jgi:hypothetical protein
MGRPFQYRSRDAFTPTGSGPRIKDVHDAQDVRVHKAHYAGRPPYMTDAAQQAKLRRQGGA